MSDNCTDNVPILIKRATFCSAFAADARDFRQYNSWVRHSHTSHSFMKGPSALPDCQCCLVCITLPAMQKVCLDFWLYGLVYAQKMLLWLHEGQELSTALTLMPTWLKMHAPLPAGAVADAGAERAAPGLLPETPFRLKEWTVKGSHCVLDKTPDRMLDIQVIISIQLRCAD